jgi:translocation protein SEC63
MIRRMPILKVNAKPEVIDDEDSTVITAGAMVTVTVSLERKSMQSLIDKSRSSTINSTNQEDLINDENDKLLNNNSKNVDENDQNQQQNKNKPPAWKKVNKKSKGKGKKKGGPNKKLPFKKHQQNNQQSSIGFSKCNWLK